MFGARPLKRTIQRYLENPLAEEILSGTFKDSSKIKVTHKKDATELKFAKAKPQAAATAEAEQE